MQPRNIGRAMIYGAVLGGAAAAFKLFSFWTGPHSLTAITREFAGAALAFALLCALVSALRNAIARWLIWPAAR